MLKYEKIDNNKKEWIVFIHGIGGSTHTWKKQIDEFSKKYNLLLLDLPGHGENADNIIKKVESYKLHKGIKDTMDYLNIKNAHFIAMSLGTIVVVNFAICNPTYVNTIILGGSVLKVCGIYRFLVSLTITMEKLLPYKILYNFFAWFMMPRENHKKSRLIFLREVVKLNKNTMYAWINYLQFALYSDEILNKLDKLNKNILLISGDEDHCFIKGAKLISSKMQSVEMEIIEKCGHVCSIENWKTFNNISLSYLSKCVA